MADKDPTNKKKTTKRRERQSGFLSSSVINDVADVLFVCSTHSACRKCERVNIEMKINLMGYCKWLYQINAVTFIEVLFVQSTN